MSAVELFEPRGASKVLCNGSTGAPNTYVAVPRLVRKGQLRKRYREEEEAGKKKGIADRVGR